MIMFLGIFLKGGVLMQNNDGSGTQMTNYPNKSENE
jgi:hypothetical protein